MSGIYIPVMEMPKNCCECFALDDYGDYPRCLITEEQRGYNFRAIERRMPKCPLISVPDHGRLIDADELLERTDYIEAEFGHIHEEIRDMPTVIPAEEG